MNVNYPNEFYNMRETWIAKNRLSLKRRGKLDTIPSLVADVVELVDTPS